MIGSELCSTYCKQIESFLERIETTRWFGQMSGKTCLPLNLSFYLLNGNWIESRQWGRQEARKNGFTEVFNVKYRKKRKAVGGNPKILMRRIGRIVWLFMAMMTTTRERGENSLNIVRIVIQRKSHLKCQHALKQYDCEPKQQIGNHLAGMF